MKTKEELKQQLTTLEGWMPFAEQTFWFSTVKKWLPFYVKSYKKKKAAENLEFMTKENKYGIATHIPLLKAVHENEHYLVGAFTTQGELSSETIEKLKSRVQDAPVNTIRYESHGNGGFYSVVYEDGRPIHTDHQITEIARDMPNVYIHVFASEKESELNCPYVVWTHNGGVICEYLIDAAYL